MCRRVITSEYSSSANRSWRNRVVDISVNIRGPRTLAESVREALEGAAHILQDLTLGNDDGLGDKRLTEIKN